MTISRAAVAWRHGGCRPGTFRLCPRRGCNAPRTRCARCCARRSISRLPPCAPSAASRSKARGSVRRAGRSFPSSPGPIASGSAFRSSMIPARASCPWKRSPIRRPINRARAAVRFDEISRALVHALKYGDRLDLAPMMGRWIGQAGRELLAEADALVPVPLHWRRLWARRFNQSAMLAAAVSAASGVPIAAGALKRVKATAQQVGLSRSERAANVQGAFRVPEEGKAAVAGRRLVAGRRCADVRRHGRGLRPGAAARRRRQRRCAGFRQGCRAGANVHITRSDSRLTRSL